MNKRVSLSDVAASLGISKTVVSLVVNNKGNASGISQETQARVREKIKELNYRPNVLARGFRTGKTETIGLIVSDISNRFYSRIARHIEDLAWKRGYSVVICSTDELIVKENKQVSLLLDRKIDGLIISSSLTDATMYNEMFDEGLPHVMIDRILPEMKSPSVTVDNYGGARLGIKHLLQHGYKDILIFATPPVHISSIQQRIKGIFDALEEEKILLPPENFIQIELGKVDQTIKEVLQDRYQSGTLPRAIFALNNISASTCVKYLRKLSVDVPDQTALIGFDDAVYFSYMKPSITAIVQPTELISETAFSMLLEQIEKKETTYPHHVKLAVDIAIRESTNKSYIY